MGGRPEAGPLISVSASHETFPFHLTEHGTLQSEQTYQLSPFRFELHLIYDQTIIIVAISPMAFTIIVLYLHLRSYNFYFL